MPRFPKAVSYLNLLQRDLQTIALIRYAFEVGRWSARISKVGKGSEADVLIILASPRGSKSELQDLPVTYW